MGYNTTILFLNDCADQIRLHPEQVVNNIVDAMRNTSRNSKTYSVGCCANAMEAMPTQHADIMRLYMTYGNAIVEFGSFKNNNLNVELRKKFLQWAKWILEEEEKEIKRLESNK